MTNLMRGVRSQGTLSYRVAQKFLFFVCSDTETKKAKTFILQIVDNHPTQLILPAEIIAYTYVYQLSTLSLFIKFVIWNYVKNIIETSDTKPNKPVIGPFGSILVDDWLNLIACSSLVQTDKQNYSKLRIFQLQNRYSKCPFPSTEFRLQSC